MKTTLSLLILLALNKALHAQDFMTDSLQYALKKNPHDSTKADIYLKLCRLYQEDQSDSAIYYSYLSEQAAIKANDLFRSGMALQQRGVSFDYGNNLDSCLCYLKKSDSIYTSIKRFDRKAAALLDIGMAYYLRGNYELGLRNYLKSLSIMRLFGEKKDVAKVLNNIGLVYRSRKDFGNAIKYYQSSLAIKKETKDENGILNTTINIGSAFLHEDVFDSAYYYSNQAFLMAEHLGNKKEVLNCKANMGAALASMNKTAEAKTLLVEAEKEAIKNSYKQSLPTIYESLGTIYSKENNPLALSYFMKALERSKMSNALESMAVFTKEIANAFAKQGNYKTAYAYLDTAKHLYDSLMNIENSRQINELSAVYESSEKEKEIQKLNIMNETHAAERNYLILSTLLFIGLSALAYKAYTGNRKKKNQLAIQNLLIEKSLSEKEILLKEIHHRVKNNLQIVSSLLSLQSNYISDEKALDAIRESKNRVQSMAIIHQNLYQDESLVNINVKEYAEKLVEHIFHSYNIYDQRITLEMDIEELQVDVDTLVPLGLILNELINNCLKYAFPEQKNGKIKVMLKQKDNTLKLSVYDNGIGIQGNESHFNQNSFGHKMIHAFMKKLKGALSIYNEDGTRVDIEIKNFKVNVT